MVTPPGLLVAAGHHTLAFTLRVDTAGGRRYKTMSFLDNRSQVFGKGV
jgi:hypothetical protein